MEREQATALLAAVSDLWDYRDFGEIAEALWVDALVDYEADDGLAALKMLAKSAIWRPSLADFIVATKAARHNRIEDAKGEARRAEIAAVGMARPLVE